MRGRVKLVALGLLGLVVAGLVSWRFAAAPPPEPEIQGLIGPRVIGPSIGPQIGPRIGAVSSSGTPALVIFGDSNAVGQGTTDTADPAFNITTTVTSVPYETQYSQAASDPITWTNLAAGGTRPYATGGVAGFGSEMAIAQSFVTAGRPLVIIKIAVSGTTCAQWQLGSGYPGTGGDLYTQARTYIRAQAAAHGATVAGFVEFLGGNDGTNSTDANNLQTNLLALSTRLHADFGAALPIVLIKSNANTSVTFLSTVRAAQVAAAGADSTISLIDDDDLALVSDHLHFTADSYITIGQRIAYTLLSRFSVPATRPSTVPDLVGFGPETLGPGTGTPSSWGGAIAGDLEVLIAMTMTTGGATNNAITTPTGWTAIANTGGTSTDGTNTTRVAAYSRVVDTTMLNANGGHTAATSIAAANSINFSRIYTIRGPNLNPTVDAALVSTNAGFLTGVTISQITTTAANELALIVPGGFRTNFNQNPVTVTFAGLTSLADRGGGNRNNGDSNFGTLDAWTGQKLVAGATGGGTATFSLATLGFVELIGIKP